MGGSVMPSHPDPKAAILADLDDILTDLFGPARHIVSPDLAIADLGLDSLDHIDLVMAIEGHFDIDVPDDQWETNPPATIADIVDRIATRQQIVANIALPATGGAA
jgi:acyl carrier protein